jgi:hypothetical protein
MEAVSDSGRLYLVRRRPDRWGYYRGQFGPAERAFLERGAAETYRQECDRRAWLDRRAVLGAMTDPCSHQSPFELTSFAPPVFLDWLQDAGIPRPPDDLRAATQCVEWWEGCIGLNEVQWIRLFEALDKVRYYEVTEVGLLADGRVAPLPDYGRLLGGQGRPEWWEERPAPDYASGFDAPELYDQPGGEDIPAGGEDIPF